MHVIPIENKHKERASTPSVRVKRVLVQACLKGIIKMQEVFFPP